MRRGTRMIANRFCLGFISSSRGDILDHTVHGYIKPVTASFSACGLHFPFTNRSQDASKKANILDAIDGVFNEAQPGLASVHPSAMHATGTVVEQTQSGNAQPGGRNGKAVCKVIYGYLLRTVDDLFVLSVQDASCLFSLDGMVTILSGAFGWFSQTTCTDTLLGSNEEPLGGHAFLGFGVFLPSAPRDNQRKHMLLLVRIHRSIELLSASTGNGETLGPGLEIQVEVLKTFGYSNGLFGPLLRSSTPSSSPLSVPSPPPFPASLTSPPHTPPRFVRDLQRSRDRQRVRVCPATFASTAHRAHLSSPLTRAGAGGSCPPGSPDKLKRGMAGLSRLVCITGFGRMTIHTPTFSAVYPLPMPTLLFEGPAIVRPHKPPATPFLRPTRGPASKVGKSPSKFSKRKKERKGRTDEKLELHPAETRRIVATRLRTSGYLNSTQPATPAICPLPVGPFDLSSPTSFVRCASPRVSIRPLPRPPHPRLLTPLQKDTGYASCCCLLLLAACCFCFCCGWPSENCPFCLNPACIILLFPPSLSFEFSSAVNPCLPSPVWPLPKRLRAQLIRYESFWAEHPRTPDRSLPGPPNERSVHSSNVSSSTTANRHYHHTLYPLYVSLPSILDACSHLLRSCYSAQHCYRAIGRLFRRPSAVERATSSWDENETLRRTSPLSLYLSSLSSSHVALRLIQPHPHQSYPLTALSHPFPFFLFSPSSLSLAPYGQVTAV
ncbi:uncharacterized protein CLUP02_17930 [Colletotrichum lupini]|uniref:Uncharacterized protein n=1 Tax=Colletotrichum lupini TaxID=145971 RepID=A0A9Q8WB83_9PEZI|nr:uncharacterized protein CLUP02_17930 [Colletotrichum lupini]UQC76417.1 hypothetical protein CLUP02_17930 [Colletotrichum lupini]